MHSVLLFSHIPFHFANLLLAQAATFKMLRCAFAAANVYMEAKISRKKQMLLCRRLRWERFVFIFFLSAAARCRFVFMSIPSKWDCCRFDCHRGYAFVVIVLVCETQLDCRVCHSISFCEPVCVCLSTRWARRNICKILSQYENVYIHWVHDVVAI